MLRHGKQKQLWVVTDDIDALRSNVRHGCVKRRQGDEAQIRRAWKRTLGVRLEFPAGEMQIDLLSAKGDRLSPLSEGDRGHAKHAFVEVACRFDAGDCKNEMIQTIDMKLARGHGTSLFR